jgi:hypothetical protein
VIIRIGSIRRLMLIQRRRVMIVGQRERRIRMMRPVGACEAGRARRRLERDACEQHDNHDAVKQEHLR